MNLGNLVATKPTKQELLKLNNQLDKAKTINLKDEEKQTAHNYREALTLLDDLIFTLEKHKELILNFSGNTSQQEKSFYWKNLLLHNSFIQLLIEAYYERGIAIILLLKKSKDELCKSPDAITAFNRSLRWNKAYVRPTMPAIAIKCYFYLTQTWYSEENSGKAFDCFTKGMGLVVNFSDDFPIGETFAKSFCFYFVFHSCWLTQQKLDYAKTKLELLQSGITHESDALDKKATNKKSLSEEVQKLLKETTPLLDGIKICHGNSEIIKQQRELIQQYSSKTPLEEEKALVTDTGLSVGKKQPGLPFTLVLIQKKFRPQKSVDAEHPRYSNPPPEELPLYGRSQSSCVIC